MMACDHEKALSLIKEGKWDESHRIVQKYSDSLSCVIHGYLHRVEGDLSNARYWNNRAGAAMLDNTLEEELDRIFSLLDAK
jgi:hypothetical protein